MERAKATLQETQAGGQSANLQFLLALNKLLFAAKIHQDNNPVLISAVHEFCSIAKSFLEEENEITLLTYGGRFFVQTEKVTYRQTLAGIIDSLLNFFNARNINGLRFFSGIEEVPASQIAFFVRILIAAEKHDDPPDWLTNKLQEESLNWVDYVPASDESLEEIITDAPPDSQKSGDSHGEAISSQDNRKEKKQDVSIKRTKKEESVLIYGYAVRALQYISQTVSSNEKAGINKAMKMVHRMIDLTTEDFSILLGLTTIKDYDDYTYTHSINVAILSMCLGYRIGLSRKSLETLTLSAFFHDLGKIEVPKDILNKPGKLNDSEFKEMKRHSLYSVRQILLLKTSQQKKAEMILPPFEHHLKYDLTGYPQTPRKNPISLFGRIISIADVYDALTSPRVYRPFAITPDRALSIMQEGAGTDFDPLLLKVFINMIGVYPIGTLLKFMDGKVGLVAEYKGDEEKELWVQFLHPSPEKTFVKGKLVSLGSYDSEAKSYNVPIAESMHPAMYNIQPAEYLL